MVPVITKSDKQKPPTPPKPVQYQPVNYRRLFDNKYTTSTSLLQIIDDHNYDTLLDRSLTDETTPLIEEEIDRHTSPAGRVKPPLLPKPQNIPPKLPDFVRHEEKQRVTNPFLRPRSPLPPPPEPSASSPEQRRTPEGRCTNPFQCDRRSTNPFELFIGRVDDCEREVARGFELLGRVHSSSHEIGGGGIFDRTRLSNDFHSLDEIHKQFNSDKECLIGKSSTYASYSYRVRKQQQHTVELDKSNRSSWRSNSDAELGDECRSRSSSINNDSDYWVKASPKSSSSGGGSPGPLKNKGNANDDEEKGDGGGGGGGGGGVDDDDSIENSSFESSYSVRRRIKTWFGSFGKGSKSAKRRDSTFYVDPEADPKNMSDTASVSSMEESNGHAIDAATDTSNNEEAATVNGIAEPLTESERRQRKALFVVRELISSEKVFIDVLTLLTRDFVNHVKAIDCDNPVIPDADLGRIVNTLPQLKSFNEELLEDFERRLANWSQYPKISDIIIKKGPFLKLFSTYIQNFENQCAYLDEYCHRYGRFSKALKDFEASARCKKLTLKHYMLKPVQRLPQYRLLLEDYLGHQNPDSMDYDDTRQALEIVCEVADHANRSVQQGQHFSKLLQLQSQLRNYEIIKPGREFVKAGELYKYSRKETHLRYFILLNDCLLYTSYYGSMSSLTVRHKLALAGMKVCIPKIEDYNNEFNIITTTRSFTLRARKPEERNEWVSVLEKTIKEHNKKQLSFSPIVIPQLEIGKEAPVWIPDHRVTMCQVCTAEFKVTFRRHHCRACGKVVCGNCSDNKAPLQYRNFQADRVCDDCYEYLSKEYIESRDIILKNIEAQFGLTEADAVPKYSNICGTFKKHDPTRKSLRKCNIPSRLKVPANVSNSHKGWLHQRSHKSWKRYWFVLKEQVLYVYKASEDIKALDTIPVLGYVVETFKEASSSYEDIDSKLVFQLAHPGQPPLVFYADTEMTAERWVTALQEAVSIS